MGRGVTACEDCEADAIASFYLPGFQFQVAFDEVPTSCPPNVFRFPESRTREGKAKQPGTHGRAG